LAYAHQFAVPGRINHSRSRTLCFGTLTPVGAGFAAGDVYVNRGPNGEARYRRPAQLPTCTCKEQVKNRRLGLLLIASPSRRLLLGHQRPKKSCVDGITNPRLRQE
jgi:hypothetical protein